MQPTVDSALNCPAAHAVHVVAAVAVSVLVSDPAAHSAHAAVDAALDAFFSHYNLSTNWPIGFSLFLLGWLCNLTAVLFALVSMHRFIGILSNFVQSPITELD